MFRLFICTVVSLLCMYRFAIITIRVSIIIVLSPDLPTAVPARL
jgi:hypothetical protein